MHVNYAPSLTSDDRRLLEETARAVGLPLDQLELLGQEPETARAFVRSVEQGWHTAFLDWVDWDRLAAQRRLNDQTWDALRARANRAEA